MAKKMLVSSLDAHGKSQGNALLFALLYCRIIERREKFSRAVFLRLLRLFRGHRLSGCLVAAPLRPLAFSRGYTPFGSIDSAPTCGPRRSCHPARGMPPTRRSFVRQLWPALLAFALDATEFALPETGETLRFAPG